jgi:hypothetical protein
MTFVVKEHVTKLDSTGKVISSEVVHTTSGDFYNTMLEHRNQESALRAEFQRTQYIRDRVMEYPPLTELADALYWQAQGDESKMTAYLAAVNAVKAKYPKGDQ